jgi:hypothetical protein
MPHEVRWEYRRVGKPPAGMPALPTQGQGPSGALPYQFESTQLRFQSGRGSVALCRNPRSRRERGYRLAKLKIGQEASVGAGDGLYQMSEKSVLEANSGLGTLALEIPNSVRRVSV